MAITHHAVQSGAMESDGITWLGTPEAARYLGISQRTLYRLIDSGELRAYKLGRVVRLQKSDVDAFIEGARIKPGTLGHLYPEAKKDTAASEASDT